MVTLRISLTALLSWDTATQGMELLKSQTVNISWMSLVVRDISWISLVGKKKKNFKKKKKVNSSLSTRYFITPPPPQSAHTYVGNSLFRNKDPSTPTLPPPLLWLGLHFGSKESGKILIIFQDLSRNLVFLRTEVKPNQGYMNEKPPPPNLWYNLPSLRHETRPSLAFPKDFKKTDIYRGFIENSVFIGN